MSSTLLEVTRAAHEDVERLERLIVKDLQNDPPTTKDGLYQSHRVRNNIDTIISTTEKLVEIYDDKDNARKDEIAALGGQTATGVNVFSAFYDRLKEIREYHRKHPAARVVDANEEYEDLLKEEPVIEFSGEEAFGRYLDLHELFNQYINSKFGAKIEYSAYLDVFSQPHNIPWKLKSTRQYRKYMENLLEYLIYFFQRTEPLQDLDRIFSKLEAEFEEQWANGQVQGWEKQGQENEDDPAQHTMIDLDYYSTVEELMEVGPEKLKEALAVLGLKTGGTVQQRAERLLLTKHTPLEKLDKKHFAKGSHGPRQNGSTAVSQDINSLKQIALVEAKMKKLCDLLSKQTIEQTKENVVKKQALTYEEMEQEREEEETQVDTESDDEDQQIYNPLKLPMGWDGKPIPYWLYKLHGLGQEFKCEICGNYSYWGRRAFERHFKEWRHQHGMRCLGIPNTKNFNEITNIQEAQELWEKIRERQGVNKWRPDLEERKVFGSQGQILKEELVGRQSENNNRNGRHVGVKLKQPVRNTVDKIVSAYQVVYGSQMDEDVIFSKCRNAISCIDKVDKEIGTDVNTGQFRGSALVEEVQGQHAVLRDCIQQLTAVASSRASLVSHLREALQEQEFKLEQVRAELQVAQSRSEHAGNICGQFLNIDNPELVAEQSSKEPQTSIAPQSFIPSATEQSAPVMYARQASFPDNSGRNEEDPRKSAAAAVAAKLTASTSSAEMLSYVLSSLASDGVIGNPMKDSSGDYPSEKRSKRENDQSYIPSQNPQQASVPPFSHPESHQHNVVTTTQQLALNEVPPPPSSSPPPLPPLPPMPPYAVPQYMPTAGSINGVTYSYSMTSQQPSLPGYSIAGAAMSGISLFATSSTNSYQSFQSSEGFHNQPSSLPTAPISRQ